MPMAHIFDPYLNTLVCVDETVVTDAYWEHTSMNYVFISVKHCSEQLTKFSFQSLFAKLRKATISFVMSVCLSVRPSAWNNLAPTGQIFL